MSAFEIAGPQGSDIQLVYAEITSNVTVSATSSASPNTVVSAGAYTFDGSTRVCIEFYAPIIQTGAGAGSNVVLALWDDSTEGPRIFTLQAVSSQTGVYTSRYLTPTAGSHTYLVRAWRTVSNGTVFAGDGSGAEPEFMPAFIRISKA